MSKQGMEWRTLRIVGMALLVAFLCCFNGGQAKAGVLDDEYVKSCTEIMGKAAKSAISKETSVMFKAGHDHNKERAKKGPKTMRFDIDKAFCINRIQVAFSVIQAIISGSYVSLIIEYAIKLITNWVCKLIETTLDNVLDAMCVALPDISLSLSASGGSGTTKSCDGTSLVDLEVTTNSLSDYIDTPSTFKVYPMSRCLYGDCDNY